MAKSPEERLIMGCSMFDAAKEIARSSIMEENPKISPREIKEKIFLRFYGREFDEDRKKKILDALKSPPG
jgi:hypothetical protein